MIRQLRLEYHLAILGFKNFINGLWSGYPLCCVLHFVVLDNGLRPIAYEHLKKYPGELGTTVYVRCPSCIYKHCKVKHIRNGGLRMNGIFAKIIAVTHGKEVKEHWHVCEEGNSNVRRSKKGYTYCQTCGATLIG